MKRETYLSNLYHSLRAPRRRHVIRILKQDQAKTVSTRELGRTISALEQEIPKQQATGEPYRNVYNALCQSHLPTLSKAGILIYDPNRQTVAPGPNLKIAVLVLELTELAVDHSLTTLR
jgi:hypothetical protein